ncbi:MAG: hypothetical protein E7324_04105 [Clostridiales bacterium]|nr:hypothetical protein [Clostridiales bacterium]
MKKILVWLMVLCSLCTVALGAENALTVSFSGPAVLEAGDSASVLKTKISATNSGKIVYTLTDMASKQVIYTETRENVQPGDTLSWKAPYDDGGLTAAKPVKRVKAAFEMDGKTYTYSFYYRYEKSGKTVKIHVERATWYPNNTACSFGPQFREVRPSLTDKWYMFTPIDLSIQGRQEFEYAAGNLYIIGKVYVDVFGDSVTVSYENFYAQGGGNTETKEEFFTFFPDLASVTDVNPETMGVESFTFGQPLSIEKDLKGDTNVLLFVRNKVTYADYVTNSAKLTRFWINHPDRVEIREEMLALMD